MVNLRSHWRSAAMTVVVAGLAILNAGPACSKTFIRRQAAMALRAENIPIAPPAGLHGEAGTTPLSAIDSIANRVPDGIDAAAVNALSKPLCEAIAPPIEIVDAEIAENAQLAQQAQVYDPLIKQELQYARRMVQIPRGGRLRIYEAAKSAGVEIAKGDLNRNGNNFLGFRGAAPNVPVPIRVRVQTAICEALAKEIPQPQYEEYAQELALRNQRERRVVIETVLVRIDKLLFLSEDQRALLFNQFNASGEIDIEQLRVLAFYGEAYMPTLPDGVLKAHLTPAQAEVWAQTQQVSFGLWFPDRGEDADLDWWRGVKS